MVKLRSLLIAGCAACLAASTSCDGSDSRDADTSNRFEVAPSDAPQLERADHSGTRTSDIRKRADAAYQEIEESGRSRFETRVGPQPWPEDLRRKWPPPSGARVVADSIQRQGNRLLLVDLPRSIDEAMDSYQYELEANGYHVRRRESDPQRHVLDAKRGDDEAILGFFGREHGTRLEILFVVSGSR